MDSMEKEEISMEQDGKNNYILISRLKDNGKKWGITSLPPWPVQNQKADG